MGGRAARRLKLWSQSGSFQITAPPLTSSLFLGKLPKLSMPQFYLENAVMNGATPAIFNED